MGTRAPLTADAGRWAAAGGRAGTGTLGRRLTLRPTLKLKLAALLCGPWALPLGSRFVIYNGRPHPLHEHALLLASVCASLPRHRHYHLSSAVLERRDVPHAPYSASHPRLARTADAHDHET